MDVRNGCLLQVEAPRRFLSLHSGCDQSRD
jgi:hypothetical protein